MSPLRSARDAESVGAADVSIFLKSKIVCLNAEIIQKRACTKQELVGHRHPLFTRWALELQMYE